MHFQDSPRSYICGVDKVISLIVLIVILGTNFPSCESHLASLIRTGDGISAKAPSFITNRVSRDPSGTQDDMEDTDLDLSSAPSSRFHFLQSPLFPMKLRPNRLSTFHHYIHGPHLNKNRARSNNIISNNNLGEDPSIFPTYRSNRDEEDEGKEFETTTTTGGDSEIKPDESSESPTYTPFISAQALTNMEKFFSNLQANIMAMHDGNLEIGQPERRKASDQALVKSTLQDSSSEPAAFFQALRWAPPASGLIRENNGPPAAPSLSSSSASASSLNGGRNRMNFVDEEDERRRAKGYNPRHLWTGMGLG